MRWGEAWGGAWAHSGAAILSQAPAPGTSIGRLDPITIELSSRDGFVIRAHNAGLVQVVWDGTAFLPGFDRSRVYQNLEASFGWFFEVRRSIGWDRPFRLEVEGLALSLGGAIL